MSFNVHFDCAKPSGEQAFDFVAEGWLEDEHGMMYFDVRPCELGFQCWSRGDGSSPLAPDEAFEKGLAAPAVWLALPERLRDSFHAVNNPDAT